MGMLLQLRDGQRQYNNSRLKITQFMASYRPLLVKFEPFLAENPKRQSLKHERERE
jgi:hypothetical protein